MSARLGLVGATALACAVTALGACREDGASPVRGTAGPLPLASVGAAADERLIVVLGSSTSAGVGPKDRENAWVPRYARYLARSHPGFRVTSLAVGGQTTYHIQPSGFEPPPGRPRPAAGRNVTAALALSPSALVVNMPSNDSAEHYSAAEQLANFDRLAGAAWAAHVPLWVTTTQPRNFAEPAQLAVQAEVRDALLRRFAPRAIDFWTSFATPAGKLAPGFDAGDGTHLNDAGHALLLERLVAAGIPQQVTAAASAP